MVSDDDLDGAVRLLNSVDAFPDKSVAAARDHLEANSDTLRQILIARAAYECGNLAEDLLGMIEADDSHSAALQSRDLLVAGLEGFLAGCGDYYLGSKWTWPKLRRSAGTHLPLDLVEDLLERNGSTDEERMRRAFERLAFTQLLLVAAFSFGWDNPAAGLWRQWGLTEARGPSRRHPWMPMRLKDGIVLTVWTTQETLGVSIQGLMLWGIARGQARSETVREMLSLLPDDSPELEREVEGYLDQLIERGAVSEGPPTWGS